MSELLSVERLKKLYGDFYTMSSLVEFDARHVPAPLRALIPYAQFWGLSDDCARESLVRAASAAALENLRSVVNDHDDALDAWLAGQEADDPNPSAAYVAFSAMRMASDFA